MTLRQQNAFIPREWAEAIARASGIAWDADLSLGCVWSNGRLEWLFA